MTTRRANDLGELVSRYGPLRDRGPLGAVLPAGYSTWSTQAALRRAPGREPLVGSSKTLDGPAAARLVARAEAAERYAFSRPPKDAHVAVLRPYRAGYLPAGELPRCSAAEYARPGCPLVPPPLGEPLRWLPAEELGTGRTVQVPAATVSYHPEGLGEPRFWYGISTGNAVHFDPARALLAGLLEVVERDALAVAWLQRLALPRVHTDALAGPARELAAWCARRHLRCAVFDATTDLAVPTAYVLLTAPHDRTIRTVVGCATAAGWDEATHRALLDAVAMRHGLRQAGDPPADLADFREVYHGAAQMARPEAAPAFDFLLRPTRTVPRPRLEPLPADPAEALRRLVERCTARGLAVYHVDRTTTELRTVGLCAKTVFVPRLQPMSLHPLARYLAHPRLYRAPGAIGHPAHEEPDLNPYPQPYA